MKPAEQKRPQRFLYRESEEALYIWDYQKEVYEKVMSDPKSISVEIIHKR